MERCADGTYPDGNYVGMEQAMCQVCGKVHDTGNILIHTQLKKVFPGYGKPEPTQYKLCEKCKQLYDDGYIAVISIDPENSSIQADDTVKIEDAYRTGRIAHIKVKAWSKVFNVPAPRNKDGVLLPAIFIDNKAFDKLVDAAP